MFKRSLLPAAAVAVLFAGPVVAQPVPPGPEPMMGAPGPHRPGPLDRRLAELHDRLGITPAQEPQWEAVVDALRDNAFAMRDSSARIAIRHGNAIESLRAMADLAGNRAQSLQRLVPVVEHLYDVLSPQQRATADRTMHDWLDRGPRRG